MSVDNSAWPTLSETLKTDFQGSKAQSAAHIWRNQCRVVRMPSSEAPTRRRRTPARLARSDLCVFLPTFARDLAAGPQAAAPTRLTSFRKPSVVIGPWRSVVNTNGDAGSARTRAGVAPGARCRGACGRRACCPCAERRGGGGSAG